MDVQVTCPRCHERQLIGDADGYTCVRCGSPWTFVRCRSCHERFHMNPGVSTWTCPACGTGNAFTPSAGGRRPAVPRSGARQGSATLHGRGLVIVAAVAVVAIGAVGWAILHHSGSSMSPAAAAAFQRLCGDVPQDFGARARALGREETAVLNDAKALSQAGDPSAARRATDLADALGALRRALIAHAPTSALTTHLSDAITALHC